jgi:hypothetical protein
MLHKLLVITAVAVGLAFTAPSAHAAMLTGGLSISSVDANGPTGGDPILPVDAAGTELSDFSGATGLDFTDTGSLTPGVAGTFEVDSTSGDFTILDSTTGTIEDFSFLLAGDSANYPYPPVIAFQVGDSGFQFDLDTITQDFNSGSSLVLSGTGTFFLDGFDPTPGVFEFSSQTTGATFSFSASESATPVPEPGSMLLLGTGLLLLGSSVRRRLARKRA